MLRYPIARVDEFPPGTRRIVRLGGRSVGVFNVGGRFYALRNRCPHQGAELCAGSLLRPLISDGPGDYKYASDVPVVQCPWHAWEFDLETGQSWFDPATRVRPYDVTVERGGALSGHEQEAGRQLGPYRLDTYRVAIEQDYVVVDMSTTATTATVRKVAE